jgi:hypothetical protein
LAFGKNVFLNSPYQETPKKRTKKKVKKKVGRWVGLGLRKFTGGGVDFLFAGPSLFYKMEMTEVLCLRAALPQQTARGKAQDGLLRPSGGSPQSWSTFLSRVCVCVYRLQPAVQDAGMFGAKRTQIAGVTSYYNTLCYAVISYIVMETIDHNNCSRWAHVTVWPTCYITRLNE